MGLTLIVYQFQVMNDPEFLQSVLQVVKTEFFSCKSIKVLLFILIEQNLPGVDPDSEAVRAAMGAMKVSLVSRPVH